MTLGAQRPLRAGERNVGGVRARPFLRASGAGLGGSCSQSFVSPSSQASSFPGGIILPLCWQKVEEASSQDNVA